MPIVYYPEATQGVQGPQGPQGSTGAAMTLLGGYPTLVDFWNGAGDYPGTAGDAWLIQEDGSIYIWDTATNTWIDAGDIVGAQGPQGPQGVQGNTGAKGDKGDTGDTGPAGADGVPNYSTSTYTPAFTATGLTYTGTPATGTYTLIGNVCSFHITLDFATVTNFGTGQYKLELPFLPLANARYHFSGWQWQDRTTNPDTTSHIILSADHVVNSTVLDLHYLLASTANPKPILEGLYTSNMNSHSPTVASISYVSGTYLVAD